MTRVFPHTLAAPARARLGLIVLQADQTIEREFRHRLPDDIDLYVSRVPSAPEVTPESLHAMAAHLRSAAALFPSGVRLDAVGYACTSGAAHIGADRVAREVRAGAEAVQVTDPLSALIAVCRMQRLRRIALVSPYRQDVSDHVRRTLDRAGIETPVIGSFDVAEEARVVRISETSIRNATRDLVRGASVDAVFLSCTNLRTLAFLADLQDEVGLAVHSSNSVLLWHLLSFIGDPA